MATRTHMLLTRLDQPAMSTVKGGCLVYLTNGPGVDIGIPLDYECGNVFLSMQAIKYIAEVAGFNLNEEGEQLEIDNAFLQHKVERLEAEKAELEDQLGTIGIALSRGTKAQP